MARSRGANTDGSRNHIRAASIGLPGLRGGEHALTLLAQLQVACERNTSVGKRCAGRHRDAYRAGVPVRTVGDGERAQRRARLVRKEQRASPEIDNGIRRNLGEVQPAPVQDVRRRGVVERDARTGRHRRAVRHRERRLSGDRDRRLFRGKRGGVELRAVAVEADPVRGVREVKRIDTGAGVGRRHGRRAARVERLRDAPHPATARGIPVRARRERRARTRLELPRHAVEHSHRAFRILCGDVVAHDAFRRVEQKVLEVTGHRLVVLRTDFLVAVNGNAVPTLGELAQRDSTVQRHAVDDEVCRREHNVIVGVQRAIARELVTLARIVLAVPFVIVAVAGIVVPAQPVVRPLCGVADRVDRKCPEEVLVFSVVGRQPRIELRYQFAPWRDAGIEVGAAVRMGVFDLLRVGQVRRLHEEEAEARVGGLERFGDVVGVRCRGSGDVGDLLERIPGVLVLARVGGGVGDVERVRAGAASAEGNLVHAVGGRRRLHRRRVVRIGLQEVAQLHARPSALVDAADVVVREAARPEREVVNAAGERLGVAAGAVLPDVERGPRRDRAVGEDARRPVKRPVAAPLIDREHAVLRARDGIERPDRRALRRKRIDVQTGPAVAHVEPRAGVRPGDVGPRSLLSRREDHARAGRARAAPALVAEDHRVAAGIRELRPHDRRKTLPAVLERKRLRAFELQARTRRDVEVFAD